MKFQKIEGIIIRRTNIGEADRIITVLTRELGKIQIKAVGVRKITSKRASHIELLNIVELQVYRGRKFLILTEARVVSTFEYIKNDLKKIGYAYHICELINGLLPEGQENPEIYGMVKYCFNTAFKENDLSSMVHRFEMKMLSTLGFWPENKPLTSIQSINMIENIMERRLKAKNIIPFML